MRESRYFFALLMVSGMSMAQPVSALVGYVANPNAKGLAVWQDVEAWRACRDEQKATGKMGVICYSAMVAAIENCTKVSYVGSAGGILSGLGFVKIRVLVGKFVGVVGVIPLDQFHDEEKDGPCNAPVPDTPAPKKKGAKRK